MIHVDSSVKHIIIVTYMLYTYNIYTCVYLISCMLIYVGATEHMNLVETYEMGLTLSSCFGQKMPYRFIGYAGHRQLVKEAKSKPAREPVINPRAYN